MEKKEEKEEFSYEEFEKAAIRETIHETVSASNNA